MPDALPPEPNDDSAKKPRRPGGNKPRQSPGGRRHLARVLALQSLYEIDLTSHDPSIVVPRTFADQDVPADIRPYVWKLVNGAIEHKDEIDVRVFKAAPAFPVSQLSSIDRNVLRIAIYELLYERDVPAKAAINEAVELAKRFGGDNSGRFVNGVLGTIVQEIGADRGTRSGNRTSGSQEQTEDS
jgi:N utilization substance protein B